jgi:hypothetical protein
VPRHCVQKYFSHYIEFEWCGKFTESLSEDDTREKVFSSPPQLATASANVPQADIVIFIKKFCDEKRGKTFV